MFLWCKRLFGLVSYDIERSPDLTRDTVELLDAEKEILRQRPGADPETVRKSLLAIYEKKHDFVKTKREFWFNRKIQVWLILAGIVLITARPTIQDLINLVTKTINDLLSIFS